MARSNHLKNSEAARSPPLKLARAISMTATKVSMWIIFWKLLLYSSRELSQKRSKPILIATPAPASSKEPINYIFQTLPRKIK